MRIPLFDRNPDPSTSLHPLAGSGAGFVPDTFSQLAFATLPEADGTRLEMQDPYLGSVNGPDGILNPPWGLDGMMPPSLLDTGNRMQPGLHDGEEGVGGAGSFLTAPAFGAKG